MNLQFLSINYALLYDMVNLEGTNYITYQHQNVFTKVVGPLRFYKIFRVFHLLIELR